MGSCFSVPAANQTLPTALVITPSGALWEFSSTIRSSLLLDASSPFFICDSDCILFDERIPALKPEEPVLPGKLYFILPVEKLDVTITGDEMAGLALRATAALSASKKKDGISMQPEKKKKKKKKKKKGRVMPGVGDDVCGDVDWVSLGRPGVAKKSIRSSLGTIEEETEV